MNSAQATFFGLLVEHIGAPRAPFYATEASPLKKLT